MEDTQRQRLEFARWRAAFHAGRAALSGTELTALAIQKGHKQVDATYARRVEVGDRPLMLEWAQSLGRLAQVSPGWLLMLDGAEEPREYREWLGKRAGVDGEEEGEDLEPPKGSIRSNAAHQAKRRRRAG